MSGRRYVPPAAVAPGDVALVEAFLGWLRAEDQSPDTLRIRRRHLFDLAAGGPLLEATPTRLVAWIDRPAWGTSSRHGARTTLSRFYGWCVDEGLLERDPSRRVPKVRQKRPVPRPVPLSVFAAAYARADLRGRRQLLIARYAGMRRMEVAKVHGRDLVDLPDGMPALIVKGKGRHSRLVPLHPLVAEHLLDLDGYLFPSDRHPSGHLDPDTVGRNVSDLLGDGWTMHTLRHRAASDWYAVTRDLRAVQELLGHASPVTTQRYTAVPDGAVVAAVLGVHTPPGTVLAPVARRTA